MQCQGKCYFQNAVDEALLIFGSDVRQSIYFYLAKEYSLQKERIRFEPNKLDSALKRMFGQGASIIERSIFKRLYPAGAALSGDFSKQLAGGCTRMKQNKFDGCTILDRMGGS